MLILSSYEDSARHNSKNICRGYKMIKLILKLLTSKALLKVVLPLLAIFLVIRLVNIWAGLGLVLVILVYLTYNNRAKVFSWIGNINYYKGNTEAARVWYNRAYNSKNPNPRTMITYGYLELKMANIDKAEMICKSVLESNISEDDKMFTRSNLALVMWKRGDIDDAIKELEEIIQTYKTTVIYGSLGYLLIEKGDLKRALELNLEAYEYNNKNLIIMDNLGQTYYLLGEYDKAKEIHDKLIPENPSFAEAWYNYGRILRQTDGPEKALEAVKKAKDYKLSFLSTVTDEQIEREIKELEEECQKKSSEGGTVT